MVEFDKQAPWWLRGWAIALYAAATVLLGWGVLRLLMRGQRQSQRRLEALVEARTSELTVKNVQLEAAGEEHARLMEQLAYQARHDSLTRLANRRAGALTTAVGDLVTQQAQVSTADVDNIFNASRSIMKPFPVDGLAMRVTSIEINASGTPSAKWTRASGSIAATDVSTVAAAMRTPNTGVLRAETVYTYRTPFQKMLPGTFTFRHKMDLSPRAGVPITFTP